MTGQPRWDVIVVGAGPGGSTSAGLLAQRGLSVLVLEKDEFPRFHIGESLLPAACVVQEMLGVTPDSDTYIYKRGAQFLCESSQREASFDFAEALPGPPRHAYHVERARFDTVLRDRARALGADIRHGVRVTGVEFESDHVRVQTEHGPLQARYFVDATGQDRLLAKQHRSIEPYRHFGKAASFVHFEGINAETRAEFAPGNDIRVLLVEDGWAWVIPLTHDRLSVGLVSRAKGLAHEDVLNYVASSPALARWTRGATRTAPRLIGNFSFRNTQSYGARYACVGDSACFIDPVFSSGVSLAMLGAVALTEQLVPAFTTGREADPELLAANRLDMKRAYDTFAALVYRFYNTRFVYNFILGAPAQGELRPGVTSVLAGDVLRDDNPFADMLLASRINAARIEGPGSAEDEAIEGC